ncbi:chlD [Symbiodinium natans]|uniref:Magnesium-chelatase subunit ChlD, chloroplastic n=1 Tax=Symbiodinium natans TaxID=878477 RepID=A0A812TJ98_9DINO|nr:chlD [Symbiodinium natans]
MAVLKAEAFALGAAPVPVVRLASKPKRALRALDDLPDRGSRGTTSAITAAVLAAGAMTKRRAEIRATAKKPLRARTQVRAAAVDDRVETAQADSMGRGMVIPMTRVEGLEEVKLALKLACIDPSLGGVGISGGHGTGKTTLARSLRGVLPKIEVVANSICNCDPNKPSEWDRLTRERLDRDDKGDVVTKVVDCPFIELPLGCTEDRLVGSLDVQASMEAGRPIFEPGLLAKAHRGVLYIDDVNLLQDDLVSLLLTAVESGVNRVEREGLSVAHPCRPLVVATWNPEEGPLRPHLLDRLAVSLNTDIDTVYTDLDDRVSATNAALDFAERPAQSLEESNADISAMQTQLLFAREFLNDVTISPDQLQRLADESSRGGCEGHRGEVFAVKIARAHAALQGRDVCNAEDLKEAIKLAILPRIRVQEANMQEEIEEEEPPPPPPPPPQPDMEDPEEMEPPPPQDQEEEDRQEEDEPEQEEQDEEDQDPDVPEEFMIDPEGAVVDPDLLKFQSQQKKSGRSGKGNKIYSMDRGRYVKAMLPKGGDAKSGKIALDATLRNAVVYQKIRREEAAKKLKPEDQRNVYVERSDIWVKKMARKAGALVIFVVDASGSMALNRMQNAKGAVLRLLENAYQNRDQVALIPCRGISAEVLVQPTSSVARASGSMKVLPCGGGTPLAHALSQAIILGSNAMKSSDVGQVCCVAITDGRANVPLAVSEGDQNALDENGKMKKVPKEDLQEEAYVLADKMRALGFKFLLIDTENKYVSSGVAKTLVDRANGRYYYLPRADDKAIAGIASDAINEMKAR